MLRKMLPIIEEVPYGKKKNNEQRKAPLILEVFWSMLYLVSPHPYVSSSHCFNDL